MKLHHIEYKLLLVFFFAIFLYSYRVKPKILKKSKDFLAFQVTSREKKICNLAGKDLRKFKGRSKIFCFFVLFAVFILHSRESELYRYTLDGKSALAWELPFSRFMGHLSST